MIFSQFTRFTDIALVFLRLMIGLVFVTSGWAHPKNPQARSKEAGLIGAFVPVKAGRQHATYRAAFPA